MKQSNQQNNLKLNHSDVKMHQIIFLKHPKLASGRKHQISGRFIKEQFYLTKDEPNSATEIPSFASTPQPLNYQS